MVDCFLCLRSRPMRCVFYRCGEALALDKAVPRGIPLVAALQSVADATRPTVLRAIVAVSITPFGPEVAP